MAGGRLRKRLQAIIYFHGYAIVTEVVSEAAQENSQTDAPEADAVERMDLRVEINNVGPCKKHIRVGIPRDAIDKLGDKLVDEYSDKVQVPGFRVGHVPGDLVRKRFRKELNEEVKQRILMQSLDQIGKDSKLEPISEPNLDLDAIEIPEEGDFEYEFEVEVRPEFDLPDYKHLKIKRPVRDVSDKDVADYANRFIDQYGKQIPVERAVKPGDYVAIDIEFTHNGQPLTKIEDVSVRVRPTLRFQDAEITGFDKLLAGATADEVRETDLTVSLEADTVEMRNEKVHAKITVLDVKELESPNLDEEFLGRLGAKSVEDLNDQIRGMLDRQVKYEQRQSVRRQVIEKITESAKWDMPEELLRKQADNALRREILEMQQAGFTTPEIAARENELRQKSLSTTRRNLKEHFVLDRIAEEEKIEVTAEDINFEVTVMALQRGENPRRVRARLAKSGMLENLEAQIRERKAVDIILEAAEYEDTPLPAPVDTAVEAIQRSVCNADVNAAEEENEAADE